MQLYLSISLVTNRVHARLHFEVFNVSMHRYGTTPYTQYCVMFTRNCNSSQYPKIIIDVRFCFPPCRTKDMLSRSLKDNFHSVELALKHQYFVYYTLHLWYISTKFGCFKPPYFGVQFPPHLVCRQ